MKTNRNLKVCLLIICSGLVGLTTFAQNNTITKENISECDGSECVCKLDRCTTIDKNIESKCRSMLEKGMAAVNGVDGQIAVIDAKTGRLKAWVALEKGNGGFADAKLLKKAYSPRIMTMVGVVPLLTDIGSKLEDSIDICRGVYNSESGLKIRDHNWRSGGYGKMTMREALVKKSNVAMYKIMLAAMGEERASNCWKKMMGNTKATNAMEMAALFGGIFNGTDFLLPTLIGDSVEVEFSGDINHFGHRYMKEIFVGLNKKDGVQAKYAPEGIELAGIYGNFAGEIYDNGETDDAEMSFVGVFPANDPIYSVCVFIHRPNEPVHSPKDLANNMVNELVAWLLKH